MMDRRRETLDRIAGKVFSRKSIVGIGICIGLAGSGPAIAATLCVNPSGHGGCFTTISAAVAAASNTTPDTIQVAQGTYQEYVVIPKPVSLIGHNPENTIIDASGQPFGINVDGHDNPGLNAVVISGFSVKNANNAGIVVSDASDVTIANNRITDNDKGLAAPHCPTLASFAYFFGEGMDCGEGVLLSGVADSTVVRNEVTGNAGGILLTDDTGPSHNDLITGNSVVKNTGGDCGITLPSHSGKGVFHNTISGNDSSYNSGAGVGLFAPGPGSQTYANVVENNRLRGNGLPGVTMHNHAAPGVGPVPAQAPAVVFNNNVILGNDISENAQDTADAATSGSTGINVYSVAPMKGTLISQNTIHQEVLDVVIKVPDGGTGPAALAHFNNLLDANTGLENDGTAVVDATENWWGCSGGPGAGGCTTVSGAGVLFTPWLEQRVEQQQDH